MLKEKIVFIKTEIKEIKKKLIALENKIFEGVKVPAQDILELRKRVETLERQVQELQPA